jgi:hypothetical protein
MKKLLLFTLLTFGLSLTAQRKNDKDDLRVAYTTANSQKVYFTINSKWFKEVDTAPVMYVAEKDIIILNAAATAHNYNDVLTRLQKDDRVKVIIQEEKKRLKCTHEVLKSDIESIILSYGIFLNDGTMLTLMIQVPKGHLAEWEPYFDNVAQTLSMHP